jgi:hypothetical protein
MSSVLNRRILRRQMWQVRKKQRDEEKKTLAHACSLTGDDEYDLGIGDNFYWFKIIYLCKH